MASLKNLFPVPVRFSGVGGLTMTNQGLKSLFPMEDIAVMGLLELLLSLNMIRVKLQETIQAALRFQPHVVVTVDSKGFSFRLLKQLRAPSFWAWKGGEARLRGLVQFVDHVLCVLPNEEEVCRSNGLAATFVGHPSLEDVWELNSKETSPHEWKMEDTRKLRRFPKEICNACRSQSHFLASWKQITRDHQNAFHLHIRYGIITSVISQASSVALCASGTVALEKQVARLPCVVAYSHFLTELIIRYEAKVPIVSLPNVLMDSPIVPEALFQACTPTNLASLMLDLIHDNGV
ncbi:hypothetical protein ACFX13_024814 [Malus domestica]